MRSKALRVCAIALAVFLGLWASLRMTQPGAEVSAQSSNAVGDIDTGQDCSRAHLASLASVVAGVLAFAVIPDRGKRAILTSASQPRRPARSGGAARRCPQCGSRKRREIVVAYGDTESGFSESGFTESRLTESGFSVDTVRR